MFHRAAGARALSPQTHTGLHPTKGPPGRMAPILPSKPSTPRTQQNAVGTGRPGHQEGGPSDKGPRLGHPGWDTLAGTARHRGGSGSLSNFPVTPVKIGPAAVTKTPGHTGLGLSPPNAGSSRTRSGHLRPTCRCPACSAPTAGPRSPCANTHVCRQEMHGPL